MPHAASGPELQPADFLVLVGRDENQKRSFTSAGAMVPRKPQWVRDLHRNVHSAPWPQPQPLSCHRTRYMPSAWLDLQKRPVMGLIVWVRAMLALRRKRKVRRKGRGKAVQAFDSKVLPDIEISLENSIPHFLLLQVIPTKSL